MRGENYVLCDEGKARLWVPNTELFRRPDGIYEPSWAPVFYNPEQTLNRDLTVALLRAVKSFMDEPRRALDAFSGTGVRAIRIAVEVGGFSEIYATDISAESYEIIRKNIELNRLLGRVRAVRIDANAFMYLMKSAGKTFSYIDIDPYGTPAPYIPASVWAVRSGGLLGVTATDTAPLSGSRWRAGSRRYLANLSRYDVPHYLGLRVLLGFIARVAASMDRSIEPLLSFHNKHYYRVFVKVSKGASGASSMLLESVGYILYCKDSGWRRVVRGGTPEHLLTDVSGECRDPALIGPLWVGGLGTAEVIQLTTSEISNTLNYLSTKERLIHLLQHLREESSLPNVYDVVSVARKSRVNTPKLSKVIECLREAGFKTVRSHLCRTCVATGAGWEDVRSCVVGG
ncbi:MAG: hypothetical protein J7L55_02390 [Desulfurococcales archaeon]|nr:hypothetical protein [Desulfurococcales archaeon]